MSEFYDDNEDYSDGYLDGYDDAAEDSVKRTAKKEARLKESLKEELSNCMVTVPQSLMEGVDQFAAWGRYLAWCNKYLKEMDIRVCEHDASAAHVDRKQLARFVESANGAFVKMNATAMKISEVWQDVTELFKLAQNSHNMTAQALETLRQQQKILNQTYEENNAIRETVCRLEEQLLPEERRTRLRETISQGGLSLKDRVDNLAAKVKPQFKAKSHISESTQKGEDWQHEG